MSSRNTPTSRGVTTSRPASVSNDADSFGLDGLEGLFDEADLAEADAFEAMDPVERQKRLAAYLLSVEKSSRGGYLANRRTNSYLINELARLGHLAENDQERAGLNQTGIIAKIKQYMVDTMAQAKLGDDDAFTEAEKAGLTELSGITPGGDVPVSGVIQDAEGNWVDGKVDIPKDGHQDFPSRVKVDLGGYEKNKDGSKKTNADKKAHVLNILEKKRRMSPDNLIAWQNTTPAELVKAVAAGNGTIDIERRVTYDDAIGDREKARAMKILRSSIGRKIIDFKDSYSHNRKPRPPPKNLEKTSPARYAELKKKYDENVAKWKDQNPEGESNMLRLSRWVDGRTIIRKRPWKSTPPKIKEKEE